MSAQHQIPRGPGRPRRRPLPCDCCETTRAFNLKQRPLLTALADRRIDDYLSLAMSAAERASERREALACCVECRNPLLATPEGFQFCCYERAGQHEKMKRALAKPALSLIARSAAAGTHARAHRSPPALPRASRRRRDSGS